MGAMRQLRKSIVVGQELHPFLSYFVFGDVLYGAFAKHNFARCVAENAQIQPHPFF